MNDNIIQDTSCTKDEAVAIMLGWSDEPIRYRHVSDYPTQEEQDNLPVYCLQDDIDDRRDTLKDEYADAKSNGLSAHDIEIKKSAISEFEKQIVLARTYCCAIDDELAKGILSTLRIDPKVSNATYIYITLTSLKAWAFQTYNLNILPGILSADSVQSKSVIPKVKSAPRVRLLKQEAAILAEIELQGEDPKRLPSDIPGMDGIKAKVRKALKGNILFSGPTVFDKAWERLSKDKYIVKLK